MKRSQRSLFWIVFFLVACSGQATPTMYIPAVQISTPITTAPTSAVPEGEDPDGTNLHRSTPTPACKSSLLFLEDLTIPDGIQVNPNQQLDKRWLVDNNGSCNWDRSFSLRLIAGSEMGPSSDMALFPARSGSRAEVQIQFTAPQEPGNYRSAWQAADPQGDLFGDLIFVEINVINP